MGLFGALIAALASKLRKIPSLVWCVVCGLSAVRSSGGNSAFFEAIDISTNREDGMLTAAGQTAILRASCSFSKCHEWHGSHGRCRREVP